MTTETPNPTPEQPSTDDAAPAQAQPTKSITTKKSLTRRLINGITKLFGKKPDEDQDGPPAVVEVVAPGAPAAVQATDATPEAAAMPPGTTQPSVFEEPPVQSFQTRRTPPREALYHVVTRDIPWSYGADRVAVIARDPDLCYAYWDVTDEGIDAARARLGEAANAHLRFVLRVYDTTGREFTGDNANAYIDIDIDRGTRGYYFSPGRPGTAVVVEVGLLSPEGYYQAVARSGEVWMPRAGLAGEATVEWLRVDADTRLRRRRPFRFAPPYTGGAAQLDGPELGEDEVLLEEGADSQAIMGRLIGLRASRTVTRETLGSEARLAERVERIGRLGKEDGAGPEYAGASEHLGASENLYAGASEHLAR